LKLSRTTFRRSLGAALLIALAVGASGLRAADAGSGDAKSAAAAAKEKAKKTTSIEELRKLYAEMSKKRDVMIAEFEALAKQMKDATEEKKKEIREKLEEQKKTFDEVTNALHKQIRDEQRKQRANAGKR
jgi:DNA anti-recombination protein RmuC